MKVAQYKHSLKNMCSFLKRNYLCKSNYLYHSLGTRDKVDMRIEGRGLVTVYKEIIEKHDYDILLFDDAFFQFDYLINAEKELRIRYIYFPCPYDFPTYHEYLVAQGLDYRIVGETSREEYEQELSEAGFKSGQGYLRYEFSIEEYKSGEHPASHIHVGPNTEIRLPSSKIITPMAFVMFALKQVYFNKWVAWIKKKDFKDTYIACKKSCPEVSPAFFSREDQHELYFV